MRRCQGSRGREGEKPGSGGDGWTIGGCNLPAGFPAPRHLSHKADHCDWWREGEGGSIWPTCR